MYSDQQLIIFLIFFCLSNIFVAFLSSKKNFDPLEIAIVGDNAQDIDKLLSSFLSEANQQDELHNGEVINILFITVANNNK